MLCIQHYFVPSIDSDTKLLLEKISILGWLGEMYYNYMYKMSSLAEMWIKGKVIVSY